MAKPGIAELVQSGFAQGTNMYQFNQEQKRMKDIFAMEQDKFQMEKDAAAEIGQVYQQENQLLQSRSMGAQVFGQLRNLAGQPTSVRKTTAPVVFQAIEKAIDAPLADNLKQLILSGKPEEIGPLMDQIIRGYANDPNQTLDSSKEFLTSPVVSAETIGNLSRQMVAKAQSESLTGPTPSPRQDKLLGEKAKRIRLIAQLEQVASRRSNTQAGRMAMEKAQAMREELSKMETLITGQAAVAEGVRPGTTLKEDGTGQISVLQGPDDSEGGSGAGGLKATDERFLRTLAAAPYENEIDLENGNISFKNRNDEIAANETTARATRIFVDAKGRLTLSEAYQEAIKKAGAGVGGGASNNPYDQF